GPGLRARAGLPPELTPGRRVPAAHPRPAGQPDLREPRSQAVLRFAVGLPRLRRWALPIRPGARHQAPSTAGGRPGPEPVDAGGWPHPPGGRGRPAGPRGEQLEPGRVTARRCPVRERTGVRAQPPAAARVLPRELVRWAVLQAARRVCGPWGALPLL